jgi:hypothetical protein
MLRQRDEMSAGGIQMKHHSMHTRVLLALLLVFGVLFNTLAANGQQGPSATFLPLLTPAVLRMHAGGSASDIWAAETGLSNSSNSSVVSTGSTIGTTLDPFPAPQAVYQTARSGVFTYTITSLTPGATYPVNFHFAEFQKTAAGQRQFNVTLNGTQVLSNFDIFAAAGGEFMAVERAFTTTASSSGTITIQFSNGSQDMALVNGIEVLAPLSTGTTLNTGVYTLTSQATGLNLDNNDSTTAGTNVIQFGGSVGNTGQQWQINKLDNGSYALVCLSNGLALDTNNLTSSGSDVVNFTTSATAPRANQQWRITPLNGGGYAVSSTANGLYLDSGASASLGAFITESKNSGSQSQTWTITPVQIGAVTPFITYEGEWGLLGNGATVVSQLVPQPTEFVTAAIEASGRAYAHLAGPDSFVQWKNLTGKAITAINVRYSIPDATNGGGINATLNLYVNGTLRQSIPMTSKQTWTYETDSTYFGSTETPGPGESAFMYWDEVHAPISGAALQPGEDITLRIDTQNTASSYDIDAIDLESPPAALSQPANSISVANFGAVPNNSNSDSTTAFQNAINAASPGQTVWIPQGTYYLSNQLQVNGVTLQGAGMWYSVLYWNVLGSYTGNNLVTGSGGTFLSLAMDSNGNREIHKYGLNLKGTNWKVDSVWLQHAGPSIWADGTGGLAQNNRINNSFADGINLNNGSGSPGSNTGNSLTAINNFVRGTGDDGIAVNDAATNPANPNASFVQMQSPTVLQNTVVAPWWANCLGIYGGVNIFVANNFTSGGSRQNGIDAGPFFPLGGKFESGKVQSNIIFQAGGKHRGAVPQPAISAGVGNSWNNDKTQISNADFRGNSITNATFDGLHAISMQTGQFANNTVNSPGMNGIEVLSGSNGDAVFDNNDVLNISPSYTPFVNLSTTFAATGAGNTGFSPH